MDEETRRLVDREEPIVLVENVERHLRRGGSGERRRLRAGQLDLVAQGEPDAGPEGRRAVHPHPAGFDPGLDLGPRDGGDMGQAPLDGAIQPLPPVSPSLAGLDAEGLRRVTQGATPGMGGRKSWNGESIRRAGMDRRTFLKTAVQVASVASAASVAGRAQKALGSEMPAPSPSGPPDRLTLAAVGDCILARRVTEIKDPDFLALVELLHGVDCAWGNSEIVLADPGKLYPSPKGIDPHGIADPWAADELRALGFRLMGTANNHTLDYGYDGLFGSLENLDRVGIAHSGAGADLALASRPGTFDSPAGRIADVNCASTFADYFPAGPAHPYVQGRPGINALHADSTVQVDAALFARLKELNARIEVLQGYREFDALVDPPPPGPKDVAQFADTPIRAGDRTDILVEARKGDVERIVQAIRTARHNSRVVIASIHAHEARTVLERPSPFLPPFAHACIDAGADLFVGAGPHVLRGIEIYQGKPIFYSLGNFLFHYETIRVIPAEALASYGLDSRSLDPTAYAEKVGYRKQRRFWQSVVPRLTWEGERLAAIDLYPVTLGFGLPVDRRGTPHLARGAEATQILTGLAELSKPFGTTIAIDDGIGRVKIG